MTFHVLIVRQVPLVVWLHTSLFSEVVLSHQVNQCFDVETKVSTLESTRVHFTKVSVLVSFIHSRMQQILRNVVNT